MTATIRRLAPLKRKRARVPLRVGDVWVLLGPQTCVEITALQPRSTFQKPHAQAVTLHDGRTIAESTLRGSYMRRHEYETVFLPQLRAKLRAAFPERCKSAEVIRLSRARVAA